VRAARRSGTARAHWCSVERAPRRTASTCKPPAPRAARRLRCRRGCAIGGGATAPAALAGSVRAAPRRASAFPTPRLVAWDVSATHRATTDFARRCAAARASAALGLGRPHRYGLHRDADAVRGAAHARAQQQPHTLCNACRARSRQSATRTSTVRHRSPTRAA
jgi:hypothetical protein